MPSSAIRASHAWSAATVIALAACGGNQASHAQLAAEGSDLDVAGSVGLANEYPTPSPVLGSSGTTVDMPNVPAFPRIDPSAILSIADVLGLGRVLDDKNVRIRGVVTWRRDCFDDNKKPGVSEADMRAFLRANPQLCDKSALVVADTKDPEKALHVVGTPPLLGVAKGAIVTLAGQLHIAPSGEVRLRFSGWVSKR